MHRREYQTAKEDLYLSALALSLERHLWTPQFAADLRTVYGNYGEASGFDQAMRFMAELGMTQRLPYGGEFTAQAREDKVGKDKDRAGDGHQGAAMHSRRAIEKKDDKAVLQDVVIERGEELSPEQRRKSA